MNFGLQVALIVVLCGCAEAVSGTCANWSSKFDGITNPDVRRELRSRGDWDALIEQSDGPQAVIATARSSIVDGRTRLKDAQISVAALAANESVARSKVSWDECQRGTSALVAAKCEVMNMQDLILSMEGTIELAQCRTHR